MQVEGKRILITGGTRGIGRALAVALHTGGAKVLACGTRSSSVRTFLEATGIGAAVCDVTEAEDVRALRESVAVELGGLDMLVNCAGVQYETDVVRGLDMHAVEHEVEVNLLGPIRVTAALLDPLLDGPSRTIVNVSSVLAWAPKRSALVYCASKAAVSSWSRGLRAQLRERNVRVVELVPPLVATDMTRGRQAGAIEPDEVAAAFLRGLRDDKDEIRVGKARLAGVLRRVAPGVLARKLQDA